MQQALKRPTTRRRGRGGDEIARLQQELDRAVDQLHDAQRDADDARRQAREAEELFAAAADERAAKVKELVQEIDHWHARRDGAADGRGGRASGGRGARNRVRDLSGVGMESRPRNQAGGAAGGDEPSLGGCGASPQGEREANGGCAPPRVEEKEQREPAMRSELEGFKTAFVFAQPAVVQGVRFGRAAKAG